MQAARERTFRVSSGNMIGIFEKRYHPTRPDRIARPGDVVGASYSPHLTLAGSWSAWRPRSARFLAADQLDSLTTAGDLIRFGQVPSQKYQYCNKDGYLGFSLVEKKTISRGFYELIVSAPVGHARSEENGSIQPGKFALKNNVVRSTESVTLKKNRIRNPSIGMASGFKSPRAFAFDDRAEDPPSWTPHSIAQALREQTSSGTSILPLRRVSSDPFGVTSLHLYNICRQFYVTQDSEYLSISLLGFASRRIWSPSYGHRESLDSRAILKAMHKGQITKADVGHKGTQLKLTLVLDDEQKVVFKPAWYSRDYIVEGPPYAGRDRHNAEIAAFHLGRILELRRSPLVVGRRVNLYKDILPVASDRLKKTFFEKDNAPCFYGRCLYCKGPEDGVCAGLDGILEGILVLWMPEHYHLKLHRHPWGRTYREGKLARWEKDDTYCAQVRAVPTYSRGPLLLDIVDTAVLDFLVGNADRHHYETMQEGGREAALIILDNGKSFGNPDHDEMSILAPLYQCCQIRASLWQRLLALQEGVLSRVLVSVLEQDPIAPILTQKHLSALDRRLGTVLDQVGACVDRVGINAIMVDSSNNSLKKDNSDSSVS
ncbi:hypothetical protein RRG08_064439 [Elysia crispata]|uniref:FAM20 C-terminal domain-containing protein n=1 Tax=Elysia crispata TaxID=231223 RepID=A0AAE1D7Z1_9GAST|nr:hypothetical protein RRG08_064439 [Elysia crispata]